MKTGVPVIADSSRCADQQLDFKRNAALLHPGNPRAQQIVADSMRSRAPCF